jgi:hypothetical protein
LLLPKAIYMEAPPRFETEWERDESAAICSGPENDRPWGRRQRF